MSLQNDLNNIDLSSIYVGDDDEFMEARHRQLVAEHGDDFVILPRFAWAAAIEWARTRGEPTVLSTLLGLGQMAEAPGEAGVSIGKRSEVVDKLLAAIVALAENQPAEYREFHNGMAKLMREHFYLVPKGVISTWIVIAAVLGNNTLGAALNNLVLLARSTPDTDAIAAIRDAAAETLVGG